MLVETSFKENDVPRQIIGVYACVVVLASCLYLISMTIGVFTVPFVYSVSALKYLPITIELSPHENLRYLIDFAWMLSTGPANLIFLIGVQLLCWIKLWPSSATKYPSIAGVIVLLPTLILGAIYSIYFYAKIRAYWKMQEQLRPLENAETSRGDMTFLNSGFIGDDGSV